MVIHRKQFLISSKKYIREDFNYIDLDNNLILSYQQELKIQVIETILGKAYILGLAYQVKKDKNTPIEELKKIITEEEILDILSTWSGRYIVILNSKLYMDFGGILGCFYGKDKNGTTYVSSSLALIKENFNINELEYEKIERNSSMDWYPGPLTILENTYRLLPSEILNIYTLEKKFKNYKIDFSNFHQEELKKEFIESFSNLLKNIEKEFNGDLLLPLTGGTDSRTILAFLLKNNIKFSSYIMEGDTKLESFDLETGKKIAKKFGFSHKIIKKNKVDKILCEKREKEFLEHSLGQSINGGREFIKYGLYDEIENKSLILRGGVFEGTLKYYFSLVNEKENNKRLEKIIEYFNLKEEELFRNKSLKLWLQSIKENKIDLDWRQRFYIEQRVGGWLSSIEQAEDLKNIETIHPMNSSYLVSLFWAFSDEYLTKTRRGQKEIIREVYPELLIFHFNKRTSIYILKRGIQIYKQEGFITMLKKGYRKLVVKK